MHPGRPLHRYTYADYVALERDSSTKHEFFDQEIYAMAGGSEDHSALASEVLRALGNAIGDRPCRVHTSDLRVYIEASGLATFPDGSVICGPLAQHPPSLCDDVKADGSYNRRFQGLANGHVIRETGKGKITMTPDAPCVSVVAAST